MKNVKCLEFISSNPDFNCVISKSEIIDEMTSMQIPIDNDAWIDYAIDHVFIDGEITDEELVLLKSPKCVKVVLNIESIGDLVEIVKWY
jgi:hypothetical protein